MIIKKDLNYSVLLDDWLEDILSTLQIYKKKMEYEVVDSYHYGFYKGKKFALQISRDNILFLKNSTKFMENGVLNYEGLLGEWAKYIFENADRYREIQGQKKIGSYEYGYARGINEGLTESVTKLAVLESPRKNKKYLNTKSKGESNPLHLIQEFHSILNRLKGFSAGHSSSNQSEMLVQHHDEVYKITIEKVGNGPIEEHMKTL